MAELPDEEDRGYAPASRPRRHPVEEEETAASPSSSLDFAAPFHAAVLFSFFFLLIMKFVRFLCRKARRLLVERYQDGVSKRYILDGNSKLQIHQEKNEHMANTLEEEEKEEANSSIPRAIKDFVLPAGFPGSVSDDYLEYMLWQLPTNVTGWICHTLVTSTLLKAVGVGSFTGTSAAASAAAIRWVSKDGIGAFGRLLIGGRFGTLFDDDPKKWRMYADFIGSAGSIFELITPLYPGYFLPLASLGNLAKKIIDSGLLKQAVGRGFRDPSFRVIQNHFAESGNLGEVAAKEEVWEVGAQLLGLSIGVFIMDTSGIKSSYPTLALTWLGVRLLHLWFRYQSLSVLKFRTVDRLLKLYRNEKYILFLNPIGTGRAAFFVTFKEAATSMSVLRSLWQAHWLDKNQLRQDDVFSWLEESVLALEHGFPDFLKQMEIAGWDQNQIILKVPKEPIMVMEHPDQEV
ncbi:hypothetical protein OsJ_00318 [Oryza sativa Japonica Group]|uniref:Protein root UVB sensitive/RUS domain-containing protein n=1 Tax=Oryza sativa subsp. japonica TaxID=39947 RepID=A2ZP39_ORYSJ|nr:hypothetical protein OsJ_00318 [Oryza sativa Japonica Group]